mgnify:CR=1 FL=1|tara:strand:- start:554 stop:1813 length:1260 start_codon:yes stop_codon:yes gene_type:complete
MYLQSNSSFFNQYNAAYFATTFQLIINIIGIIFFTNILFRVNVDNINSNIYSLFENKKNQKTLFVLTDPDEDLDDEIALYHLFKYLEDNNIEFKEVFIVFAPGANKTKNSSLDRKNVFFKYFPQYNKDSFMIHNTRITLLLGEQLKDIKEKEFDIFLQIAPMVNIHPTFFENNTFKKRVVMGDLTNPKNSLNLSKSWTSTDLNSNKLDEEFKLQEDALKTVPSISITTNLSRTVPFTYDMIESLPKEFSNYILEKAFKQFAYRVPSHLSYCENVTVFANWNTVKNYLPAYNNYKLMELYLLLPNNIKYTVTSQIDGFIDNMITLENPPKMRRALIEIYMTVYIITGELYKNETFAVDSIQNKDKAQTQFINFVKNNKSSLTPAYDLLAMHVVLHELFDNEVLDETFKDTMIEDLTKYYS